MIQSEFLKEKTNSYFFRQHDDSHKMHFNTSILLSSDYMSIVHHPVGTGNAVVAVLVFMVGGGAGNVAVVVVLLVTVVPGDAIVAVSGSSWASTSSGFQRRSSGRSSGRS